jgi:hypothetical protein
MTRDLVYGVSQPYLHCWLSSMLFPYCGPVMHDCHKLLEICVFDIPRLGGSCFILSICSYKLCSCFEYQYLVRTGLAPLVMIWMPEHVEETPKR